MTKAIAAAVLLAALSTSCAWRLGPDVLQTPPPARPDDAYWAAVRDAVAEHTAGRHPSGESSREWLLPYVGVERRAEVPMSGDRVDATVTRGVNLGLYWVPVLPLWFARDTYVAERGVDAREVSSVWFTPLWADARAAPDAERRVDVAGVPLVYWNVHEATETSAFTWHQTLWTLGPGFGWGHDDEAQSGAWFALPVVAGGLGAALWLSIERWEPGERVGGHGPFGALWFHGTTQDTSETPLSWLDAEARGLVSGSFGGLLLGALWTDIEASDADGRVVTARRGPLWSALGWGRDEGEPVLWLFGLAIPL